MNLQQWFAQHINVKQIYIIVFSILAFWAFFAYFTMNGVITEQKKYAKLINISGKQRMLSQRTALVAFKYFQSANTEHYDELSSLMTLMKKDHTFLIHNITSETIRNLYFTELHLDEKVKKYFKLITVFLEQSNQSNLSALLNFSNALLPQLNDAVTLFEKESDAKIQSLQEREQFILYGTLITLLLEFLFLIRPISKMLSAKTEKLQYEISEKTKKIEQLLKKSQDNERRLFETNETLKTVSVTDELTGIGNRRQCDKILKKSVFMQQFEQEPLSILLLDLDDFKVINDSHGHNSGDTVLKMFVQCCQSVVRHGDFIGRWGGEEFLIICPHASESSSLMVANKICEAVRQLKFPFKANITVSIGVTQNDLENNDFNLLIEHADEALYKAKENGKDLAVSYSSLFNTLKN